MLDFQLEGENENEDAEFYISFTVSDDNHKTEPFVPKNSKTILEDFEW